MLPLHLPSALLAVLVLLFQSASNAEAAPLEHVEKGDKDLVGEAEAVGAKEQDDAQSPANMMMTYFYRLITQ